jgi:acyl-CoA-dependent ceramide synthase
MKGYGDLVFVAYYLVVWSFIRQTILTQIAVPNARRFGIKKRAKVERFGEQLYALLYFGIFGAWGVVRTIAAAPGRA